MEGRTVTGGYGFRRGAGLGAALGAVLLSLGAGGCVRTSDGSIEMVSVSTGTWWGRHNARNFDASAFPSQPAGPPVGAARPRRHGADTARPRRPRAGNSGLDLTPQTPFNEGGDSSQPLECQNATTESGRVKVVCR